MCTFIQEACEKRASRLVLASVLARGSMTHALDGAARHFQENGVATPGTPYLGEANFKSSTTPRHLTAP